MTPQQARRAYRELESAPPTFRIGERKPRYDAVLFLIWVVVIGVVFLICAAVVFGVRWLIGVIG